MRFELPGYAEDRAKRRSQIPEWIAAAEAGSVDAQLALAWEYARGDVIQVDIANAWYWFERAAGSGQDVAVVNWARFLQLRGVPEGVRALHADRLNQLRAVVWYDPVI
jgi:TPR repeat protein